MTKTVAEISEEASLNHRRTKYATSRTTNVPYAISRLTREQHIMTIKRHGPTKAERSYRMAERYMRNVIASNTIQRD